MFIDRVKIVIKAGDGGNGCITCFPNSGGGRGGKGGNVLFQGDSNLTSLSKLQTQKIWRAGNGENGSRNKKNGKSGKNIVIKLPLGTEIQYNNHSYHIESERKLLFQCGGKGGSGKNNCFPTSVNVTNEGQKIEPLELQLIFKLNAHIGIIGMPNSGKSSLINRITNAKSKVADYAFSTLHPYLSKNSNNISFVDVPGLIKGASINKGLGHRFLSHIEKCKVLLLLIDISDQPIESIQIIQHELKEYGGLEQNQVICFNKCEKLKKKQQKQIRQKYPKAFFISVHKSSLTKLMNYLIKKCQIK